MITSSMYSQAKQYIENKNETLKADLERDTKLQFDPKASADEKISKLNGVLSSMKAVREDIEGEARQIKQYYSFKEGGLKGVYQWLKDKLSGSKVFKQVESEMQDLDSAMAQIKTQLREIRQATPRQRPSETLTGKTAPMTDQQKEELFTKDLKQPDKSHIEHFFEEDVFTTGKEAEKGEKKPLTAEDQAKQQAKMLADELMARKNITITGPKGSMPNLAEQQGGEDVTFLSKQPPRKQKPEAAKPETKPAAPAKPQVEVPLDTRTKQFIGQTRDIFQNAYQKDVEQAVNKFVSANKNTLSTRSFAQAFDKLDSLQKYVKQTFPGNPKLTVDPAKPDSTNGFLKALFDPKINADEMEDWIGLSWDKEPEIQLPAHMRERPPLTDEEQLDASRQAAFARAAELEAEAEPEEAAPPLPPKAPPLPPRPLLYRMDTTQLSDQVGTDLAKVVPQADVERMRTALLAAIRKDIPPGDTATEKESYIKLINTLQDMAKAGRTFAIPDGANDNAIRDVAVRVVAREGLTPRGTFDKAWRSFFQPRDLQMVQAHLTAYYPNLTVDELKVASERLSALKEPGTVIFPRNAEIERAFFTLLFAGAPVDNLSRMVERQADGTAIITLT